MAGVEKVKERAFSVNGALTIFAKTPSLSPVKTRLAAGIGISFAKAFYALSIESVAEIAKHTQMQSENMLTPYWALAEEQALDYPKWHTFETLWTGEGGLGKRLHHIYSTLRKKNDYVMMIGTDSPQLEPELITSAIKKLAEQPKSCVIGPCPDGGFYLFAAKIPIPEEMWTNVTYSTDTTLQELIKQLSKHDIDVYLLPQQEDIDIVSDIKPLINSLESNNHLLPAQQKLYRWLKSQTAILNLDNKGVV